MAFADALTDVRSLTVHLGHDLIDGGRSDEAGVQAL